MRLYERLLRTAFHLAIASQRRRACPQSAGLGFAHLCPETLNQWELHPYSMPMFPGSSWANNLLAAARTQSIFSVSHDRCTSNAVGNGQSPSGACNTAGVCY